MNGIDALDLDGRLLQLLVAVVEERSVTRAAERLALTQSAVSHGLERLRQLTGDALVVRAGRGIAPTPRAEALAAQAREVLGALRGFAQPERFEPAACSATLVIAANPLQRDLLLPPLLARLQAAAPRVALRIVHSAVPSAEKLRNPELHLVISPRRPDADDIECQPLFSDSWQVFYDAEQRDAPATRKAYEAAEHVAVRYEDGRNLDIDRYLADRGVQRRVVAQVPDFSGVAPFVRGTSRLATLPALTAVNLMRGLAAAPVPLPCPPMPMWMLWHRRWQADAMHGWLRAELASVASGVAAVAGAAARV